MFNFRDLRVEKFRFVGDDKIEGTVLMKNIKMDNKTVFVQNFTRNKIYYKESFYGKSVKNIENVWYVEIIRQRTICECLGLIKYDIVGYVSRDHCISEEEFFQLEKDLQIAKMKLENEKKAKKQPYVKDKISKQLRNLVWVKTFNDKLTGLCPCCERTEVSVFDFHCGHLTSQYHQGKTELSNLLAICASCNLSMSTKSFDEFKKQFQ